MSTISGTVTHSVTLAATGVSPAADDRVNRFGNERRHRRCDLRPRHELVDGDQSGPGLGHRRERRYAPSHNGGIYLAGRRFGYQRQTDRYDGG